MLIIDEVFDYLDDANLITAQYFLNKMINKYKAKQKLLYPIILTHLDPNIFKNFYLNSINVIYLNKNTVSNGTPTFKLIMKREREIKDSPLYNEISSNYLHYNECKSSSGGIKQIIGHYMVNNVKYYQHLENKFNSFLKDTHTTDPLAICIYTRIAIEKNAYEAIQASNLRAEFLQQHKTVEKLNFAQRNGVLVEELHYLLAIVYNQAAHINLNYHNQLEKINHMLNNLTIQNMLNQLPKSLT